MKMRKIIVLAMTVLLFTGCGDSTSLEEKRVNNDIAATETVGADETVETEKVTVQGNAEYIGTFGKDIFFSGIDEYIGCEFDITMVYEARDMEGYYVFNAVEKTAEGSTVGHFRVEDKTEGMILEETENYSSLDNLAVEMRVVLDNVVIYEEDGTDDISLEYEVRAKEATFLPLDSIEAKLARSGYFAVGNTINYNSGMSVYIVETGYSTYNGSLECVYIEVEITNNGEEDVSLLDADFYGDDYALERAYLADGDIMSGTYLSPGRKVRGYYAAAASRGSYSVIEAEIGNAIILVDYSMKQTGITNIYGTYIYDNGVDAIMSGDVGFYTDYEGDYIYLAALYYDSNHYTAEIQGTLEYISENTFHVKDEITGTVELEVNFVDGGMEVTILSTESNEYNVLEGHYDMISELNLNEVS